MEEAGTGEFLVSACVLRLARQVDHEERLLCFPGLLGSLLVLFLVFLMFGHEFLLQYWGENIIIDVLMGTSY